MENNYIIAIDGPAGAGKSTIAKLVARKLGIIYIDTGAMYRAITYKCLVSGIDLGFLSEDDFESNRLITKIIKMAKDTEIDFNGDSILIDGNKRDDEIRSSEVTKNVSGVSKIKEVREIMVLHQRNITNKSSALLDGRDIGTVVFPNADYKFFLTAEADERARRRYNQLKEKGVEVDFDSLVDEIKARDEQDMNRKVSPLKKADDAIEVDSTNMSIEEVVDFITKTVLEGRGSDV